MNNVQTPPMVVAPSGRICPRCGAPIGGFGPEGLCGACLFDSGLAADEPAAELDLLSTGARRFGDYELLEEIARGGMGVVFRARQLSLDRIVAVKMILRGEFASMADLARFRLEAETVARLQHPKIVAIHEVGEREGQPFFSMDYVAGQNLAQLVGNIPLPAMRAANYLQAVAEAIQYAHQHGVLHRDLKPSNVLIDASDQPHVTDFGLAKRTVTPAGTPAPHDLTLTGQVLGSPSFIPPEQAAGKDDAIGPASDVYSLGAILYHLLTARPPFVAETLGQTLRLVAEAEPISPRLLVPSVPRDLETICLKCLRKEPHRRYLTAQGLADDLNHFLRDEPIQARPVSQGERVWRWCRRNPALAGAASLVALLLVTMAIGSTAAAARLKKANHEGQEKLRDSLIFQTRAGRWSGHVGQRFDGLEAVKKAVEIRPSIELRNEAIACLALVDMRPVKVLHQPQGTYFDFDPTYARYASGDAEGNFVVRRMKDDAESDRFPGLPAAGFGPYFSPRGRYLAICRIARGIRPLQICDLERHEILFSLTNSHVRDLDFSPDERFVYVAQAGAPPSKILRLSIPSGESKELLRLNEVPSAARLNPAGDRLAVSSTESRKVQVLNAETGEVIFSLEHPDVVYSLRWHPEGRLLATACADRRIYVWDTVDRNQVRVLEGHDSVVTSVCFSHDGELLASCGWDGTARLWNTWTGRQILKQPTSGYELDEFSADDRLHTLREGDSIKVCEVAGGREWRGFYLTKSTGPLGGGCAWSPDGRVLASAHRDGSRLWDVSAAREIGLLPCAVGEPWFINFDPSGSNLVATTGNGLRCWGVNWQRNEAGDKLVLGPRQSVGAKLNTGGGLSFNQSGNRLAAEIGGAIEIFEWPSCRPLRTLQLPPGVFGFVLSPSGRFCVGWPRAGELPRRVWDVNTGAVLANLPVVGVYGAAFRPNDDLLVTGNGSEYQAWDTRSWTNVWKLSRPRSLQQGRMTFNPRGTMGAFTFAGNTIRLFEPATGHELATLEAPDAQNMMGLAFSPDGSQLAATTVSSVVHMWDLRLIRQELAAMKLDWDRPPAPPVAALAKKPISVEVTPDAGRGLPLSFKSYLPPRDPGCGSRLIDLSAQFNASLTSSWFNALLWPGNDLASLPTGRQTLAGVEFDVRGIVQVGSANQDLAVNYPATVKGVSINQTCKALNFLHATGWIVPLGNRIGEYQIHYADGRVISVPLRMGLNIGGWFGSSREFASSTTNDWVYSIAWRGRNVLTQKQNLELLLYKLRWHNPHPEVAVQSIDFNSAMSQSAPFLLAITAE